MFRSLLSKASKSLLSSVAPCTATRAVFRAAPIAACRRMHVAPPQPDSTKPPEPEEPLTETVRTFLDPADFHEMLAKNNMNFYTGVPDSLLKNFCAFISDHSPASHHVIAANEGAAIGLASGYHLASGSFPVVYMQNSGLGNSMNPLLSLADPKVYSIPMLLLIGWRGEPGKKDEPQHIVQGKVMPALLADMNIPFEILPDYYDGALEAVSSAVHYLEKRNGPYAFLVKKQTFAGYKLKKKPQNPYTVTREHALRLLVDSMRTWDIVVSTTGFASRELYELRDAKDKDHRRDFLTVGSMGHSAAIALGIAIAKPSREVFCMDGDGAVLMHMGSMATIGQSHCSNFKHVLLNNGVHDSVGGQPTVGHQIDFVKIATSCGYKTVLTAATEPEIVAAIAKMKASPGPVFLEIKLKPGARKDLGRPKTTPLQNKMQFMKFLES